MPTPAISPADMLLFASVIREGSFTRAASQGGITKQTASERIAKLEERLGVRLIERTTRRLRVTDAGAAYFERCSAIAAQIDEANVEVQQRQVEPVGLLRVAAPVLYGRRFLGPVVADYLGRFPGTRVELVLANRRVNLIEEGVDIAVRIGALEDSSLVARKIGEGYVYDVASPAFIAAHAPRARNPSAVRCVGTRPVETWDRDGVRHQVEPVLVVNDLEVACEAAIAGVGMARLPSLVCAEAVGDGRLQVLSGPEPAALRGVYAVYASRRYLAPKVRVFLDALVAIVEPMLPLDAASSNEKQDAKRPAVSSRGGPTGPTAQ